MGRSCAICDSRYDKSTPKSFHMFPKNPEVRAQWCHIIGFEMDVLPKHTFLCSDHFSPDDIHSFPSGLKYLAKGALPIVAIARKLTEAAADTSSEEVFEIPQGTCAITSSSSSSMGKIIRQKANILDHSSSSSDSDRIPKRFKPTSESSTKLKIPGTSKASDTSGTITASETEGEKAIFSSKRRSLSHKFGKCSTEDMRNPRKVSSDFSTKLIQQQRLIKAKLKRANKRLTEKDYCKKYIQSLNLQGNSILLTKRKTGFLGYLICIESLQCMYDDYVSSDTPLFDYILSYKLSQDHIEVYFSSVRSYFGFNNNPTAQQFEAIYKRLLVHTEIKGSNFANATAMDNTTILSVSSVTKSSLGENFEECEDYIEMVNSCEDHDYINSASWHLSVCGRCG